MTEEQLQSKIAIEFSVRYPEKAGQLFHVANERNNKIQAYKAKSIGIYPGVADFIFFSKDMNIATELKAPNTRHKSSHVRKQLEWGRTWEREGNIWRLCVTAEQALSCYEGKLQGFTIDEVEKMIGNKKTIKF